MNKIKFSAREEIFDSAGCVEGSYESVLCFRHAVVKAVNGFDITHKVIPHEDVKITDFSCEICGMGDSE